jgi:hypothetical protein
MDKCIADAGKKGQCQRDFTLGNYFYDNFNEIMRECRRKIRADTQFKSDVLNHMSASIEKNYSVRPNVNSNPRPERVYKDYGYSYSEIHRDAIFSLNWCGKN